MNSYEWWQFVLAALAAVGSVVATAVAIYFILSALLLTIGSERTARRLIDEYQTSDSKTARIRFVVILPMLREDRVVRRAMGQFINAMKKGLPIDVVVATTAREAEQRAVIISEIEARLRQGAFDSAQLHTLASMVMDQQQTQKFQALLSESADISRAQRYLQEHLRFDTGTVAEQLLPEFNGAVGRDAFFHVQAPLAAEGKVGQMNAAVAYWREQRPEAHPGDVYIGVYDADSSPDQRVFDSISRLIGERDQVQGIRPGIFQQVSCYCQNLIDLKGVIGAISFADALAQTRWALGFEYPLYEKYARSVQRGELRRLVYCVGHGCFVSLDVLDRINGFPTCSPNDDLALGYLASVAGIEVHPIPVLDYCDVAPNPFGSIRQSRFWYVGSSRFHRDIEIFKRQLKLRPSLLQRIWLYVDGSARGFCWAWRPTLWLASSFFAGVTGSWWLFALLLVAHLLYVQVGFIYTLFVLRRLPGAAEALKLKRLSIGRVLLAMVLSSLTFVVRSLGPLSASLGIKLPQPNRIAWKIER